MITRYSDFVFKPKDKSNTYKDAVLESKIDKVDDSLLEEGLLDDIMELPLYQSEPIDFEEENDEEYYSEPEEKTITDFIDPAYIKSTKPAFVPEPEKIIEKPIISEPRINMDPLAYKIFRDKAESFECRVMIEGSDVKNTAVRLILESEEWNIFFKGSINGGVCTIPLKKISILSPGLKGVIKLEVVVDGEIFYPWYETFQVQNSKNVKVEVLSQKKNNQVQSGTSVKIV